MVTVALTIWLPAFEVPVLNRPPEPSLDDLLVQVAGGDRAAFSHFYDGVIGTVFGLARSVVRDPARAEEIAHDVMLEVWAKAHTFSTERGSARAWVATITRRRAIDVVRSEQATRRRDTRSVEPAVLAGDPVADTVADRDDRERIRAGLESLTEIQREAIELAYFGGLTYRQVADHLDLPLGTVKTRMRDALGRLAAIMEADR